MNVAWNNQWLKLVIYLQSYFLIGNCIKSVSLTTNGPKLFYWLTLFRITWTIKSKAKFIKLIKWKKSLMKHVKKVWNLKKSRKMNLPFKWSMTDSLLSWQLLPIHSYRIIDSDSSWLISNDLIDFTAFSVFCRNLHDCTCRGCRGAGTGWAGLPGLRHRGWTCRSQRWGILWPEGGQAGRREAVWAAAGHGADPHEPRCNEPESPRHQNCTTGNRTHLRIRSMTTNKTAG